MDEKNRLFSFLSKKQCVSDLQSKGRYVGVGGIIELISSFVLLIFLMHISAQRKYLFLEWKLIRESGITLGKIWPSVSTFSYHWFQWEKTKRMFYGQYFTSD